MRVGLLSVATLAVAGPAWEEQTTASNSPNSVPDNMRLDVPCGVPILLEHAKVAILAAVAEAGAAVIYGPS